MPKASQRPTTTRRALVLGAGALSALGITAGIAASVADLSPNPDAELIATCRQHIAARDAVDRAENIADDHPLWLAFDRTQAAICDARPSTMEGVLAKAEAAKAIATNLDGSVDPGNTMAEVWAWDLVTDLLRLAGRA